MAKRKTPGINASSMADISFLLLIFFLVTTSMNVNSGLSRKLPPPLPPGAEQPDVEVNKRNVFVVLINSNNQIMAQGQMVNIRDLKEKAKLFIQNPANDPTLPALTPVNIPLIGNINVTKEHVISLQNDRGTDYQAYLEVQNELVAAYNELRESLAIEKFGTHYAACSEEQQDAINKVYPQKISEAEPKNYGGQK
ncbi:MAG: biopolymer transporter ExbD [Paludibacteraceae bacterium]|nr:biopolymer transporter ExbD [Paludibacteraceae bacterium]MBP5743176.1 biopolymer transporter ExbD [Paludibacteraceae bacterium]